MLGVHSENVHESFSHSLVASRIKRNLVLLLFRQTILQQDSYKIFPSLVRIDLGAYREGALFKVIRILLYRHYGLQWNSIEWTWVHVLSIDENTISLDKHKAGNFTEGYEIALTDEPR
jgi:hypothetical protein